MPNSTPPPSAHTPGYWQIQEEKDKIHVVAVDRTEYPEHVQLIATLSSILPRKHARLIAAAPELLERLKTAVEIELDQEPESRNISDADIADMLAVIAKAEGRA